MKPMSKFKLHIPKDSTNLVIEAFTTVAHVKDLESLFDGHTSLEGLVVHEELHKVEELAWL